MDELKLRLKKLRATGVFEKVDKIVLYNPESNHIDPNFLYLSGLSVEYSILVVRPRDVTLYTVPMIAPRAQTTCRVVITEKLGDVMCKHLPDAGINGSFLPYNVHRRFKSRVHDVSTFLMKAREIKTEDEIANIRVAVREAERALQTTDVSQGRRESDVAADLEYAMARHGFDPSFETIVATNPNTASPHHRPTKRKLKDLCYIDFGVRYRGYCSDLTRAFAFARKYREHVQTVRDVMNHIEDMIKPGVKTSDLHSEAERILKTQMIHALGHGIGIDVHEAPAIASSSKDLLQKGMTIAIEPAFYTKRFGIRLENNYVVTANGCKRL